MNIILDPNDSRIADFISVRDHVLHKRNLIIVEAEKLFLQHKAANKNIFKLLATEEFIKRHNLSGDNIFSAQKDVLEKVAGFKLEFEVLFLTQKPEDTHISKLDERIILINGLTSPENVGSIVRSSAAFGIKSIGFFICRNFEVTF